MTLDARRRLHDLLESRVDLLRQVEVLSLRRSEAIAAGRVDAISRLLAEREPLVTALAGSAGDVESLANAVAGSVDPELLALVERASALVESIAELDARDEKAMTASRLQTRQELERVSNANRAGRAYQGVRPSSGHRMERSG